MFEIRDDGPFGGEPDSPQGLLPAGESDLAVRPVGAAAPLQVYGGYPPPPGRRAFSPRLLMRFKSQILLVTLLGAAVCIPAIWMLIEPKYYASALIEIKPTTQRQIYKVEENGIMPLYQQFVNTNVALIRSPVVLNRVLDDSIVQQTAWYSKPTRSFLQSAPKPAYERLLDDLKVSNTKGTAFIEIGFSSTQPKDAQIIVSTIVRQYLESTNTSEELRTNELANFLKHEEVSLRERLRELITARGLATSKFGSASLEELQTSRNNEKLKIEAQLHEIEVSIKMTEWDRKWTQQMLEARRSGEGEASAPASTDAGDEPTRLFWSDREWSRLYQDYEARSFALDQKLQSSNMGEAHPLIRELKKAKELARERLDEREKQLLAGGNAAVAAMAAVDKSVDPETRLKELEVVQQRSQEHARILTEAIGQQEQLIREVGDAAAELRLMDQDIEQITAKYKAVQERIAQVESELVNGEPGRIKSITEGQAQVSSRPQNDRRFLFSAAALFGWFGLALGIAYLRGMLDTSMTDVSDVTGTVRVPFLGQMPRFSPGTDALSDTSPMLQESIRMIRTALLERCAGKQGYAVLVTSPNVGSGKTTFAMLLARSLGHVGKRVLLVDTDLRRASLTERLGAADEPGLVDLLRNGKASASSIARFSDRLGVHLIPTGRRATVDDAERMANGKFSASLREWRMEYDFVILDGAPVLPVADARILAGQTDGTIMAMRASQTRRTEALEALAELNAAGAKLFGTVLIGTDPRSGYYRGYDYGSLARPESAAVT